MTKWYAKWYAKEQIPLLFPNYIIEGWDKYGTVEVLFGKQTCHWNILSLNMVMHLLLHCFPIDSFS